MSPSESGLIDAKKVKVVVITTVMLSFISYWRASAIVLSDLASSAYYALGIAEKAVGPSAMVCSFCYVVCLWHPCGLYRIVQYVRSRRSVRVVHEALGETAAKFSVSALLFDYLITAPISAVSAGLYIAGLLNALFYYGGVNIVLNANIVAVIAAVSIQFYFWRKNIIGIEESSEKAMRIFQITSILAGGVFVWSIATISIHGVHLPPFSIELSEMML